MQRTTARGALARLERLARREDTCQVPQPVAGPPGILVDATWGTISPLQLAPGVDTFGELEVIDHIAAGCRSSTPGSSTSPGRHDPDRRNIPHAQIVERSTRSTGTSDRLLLQRAAMRRQHDAVNALAPIGCPARALAYYRGGIHDWVTLGLPLVSRH